MEAMCRAGRWKVPSRGFCINPINSPAALLHWRAISFLLGHLSQEQRQTIWDKYSEIKKQPNMDAAQEEKKSPTDGHPIPPIAEKEAQKTAGTQRAADHQVTPGLSAMETTSTASPVITAEGDTVSALSMNVFQQQLIEHHVRLTISPASPVKSREEPMEIQTASPEVEVLASPLLDYTGTPSSGRSENVLNLETVSPSRSEEDRLLSGQATDSPAHTSGPQKQPSEYIQSVAASPASDGHEDVAGPNIR